MNNNKYCERMSRKLMKKYFDRVMKTDVRVDLLPFSHNAMSEYQKYADGTSEIKPAYRNSEKLIVGIHETTPGRTPKMNKIIKDNIGKIARPTKPGAWQVASARYDKLIRYASIKPEAMYIYDEKMIDVQDLQPKNGILKDKYSEIVNIKIPQPEIVGLKNPYGDSIGYHARIDSPGMLGRNEIVIKMPLVCSPAHIANNELGPDTYGIERLVGEEQNYHLGIMMQAMLTAFVLREIGYNEKTWRGFCFPHLFFANTNKACPARMMYAETLLEKSKQKRLTKQEKADMKEYVPWSTFLNLIQKFLEKNEFPKELEKKFIYSFENAEEYLQKTKEGKEYNYRQIRPLDTIEPNSDYPYFMEEIVNKVTNIDEKDRDKKKTEKKVTEQDAEPVRKQNIDFFPPTVNIRDKYKFVTKEAIKDKYINVVQEGYKKEQIDFER